MKNDDVSLKQRGDTMNIGMTTKGDFKNTESWLKRVARGNPTATLKAIGAEGVTRVSAATPRKTGATAAGWGCKVKKTSSGYDLIWYNNAHPETSANVAKLLQLGHGTGTGGYVPGRDYINPALRPVMDKAGDKIVKELIK